jgi:hypothetical protein
MSNRGGVRHPAAAKSGVGSLKHHALGGDPSRAIAIPDCVNLSRLAAVGLGLISARCAANRSVHAATSHEDVRIATDERAWPAIGAVTPTRLPLWSDVDPSWPDTHIDVFAPSGDDTRYVAFESAVGSPLARSLDPSPIDGIDAEYCRDRHALAWIPPADAARCDMRALDRTRWHATVLLFRRSGADLDARAARLWDDVARRFDEPHAEARASK